MSVVRIFKPAKRATQSGKSATQNWVMEFDPEIPEKIEPLMGYTSSSDMKMQVRLFFKTEEEAIEYAKKNQLDFRLEKNQETKHSKISYADNFLYHRKDPWTH